MKYFTDEQLSEEIKPKSKKALEALNRGDVPRVYYLLEEMAIGHRELDTLGIQWFGRMLGFACKEFGDDYVHTMLSESADYLMTPFADDWLEGKEKEFICDIVEIWKNQVSSQLYPAGETDTEVVFNLSPCGSGGRVVLEGLSQSEPEFFSPFSDGTPIICSGCKKLQDAVNRKCGKKVWSTDINPTVSGSCRMRFVKDKTRDQRLFDSHELYKMVKSRSRQAMEKLQAGDFEIGDLLHNQQHEWKPWHDLIVQFMACIQSYIYRDKGASYLDKFLKRTYDTAFAMFYPAYETLDDLTLFRMFVNLWHYHMADFKVMEDEDKFTFILNPCGSGGRMYRSQMHKGYFQYDNGLPCLMKEPANINFNRKDFPIYCTHCASSNRISLRVIHLFS